MALFKINKKIIDSSKDDFYFYFGGALKETISEDSRRKCR